MKKLLFLALVGLAIGFPAPTLAQEQKAVDPEVRQKIEAPLMKFVEAYNNRDVATISALHTQDAVEVRSRRQYSCWYVFRATSYRENLCSRLCIKSSKARERACSGVCDRREQYMRDSE